MTEANQHDSARKPVRMHGLDLLRMVLALAVLLYHYLFYGPITGEAPGTEGPAGLFWLRFGVSVFFLISGYVIFLSMRGRGASAFTRARILRLWPALLVCSVLTVLAVAISGDLTNDDRMAWVRAFTLAPLMEQRVYLDASYWSLTYELRFYLLVAGLIALGWRQNALLAVTALGLTEAVSHGAGYEAGILFPYTGLFGLGMALALAREERGVRAGTFVAINFAVASCGLAIQIAQHALAPAMIDTGNEALLGGVAVTAFGAFLVAGAACLQIPPRYAGICGVLGAASYPLYLLHQRAGYLLIGDLATWGLSRAVAVAITTALMTAAAMAIAVWFEPPIRRLIARCIPQKRDRMEEVAA